MKSKPTGRTPAIKNSPEATISFVPNRTASLVPRIEEIATNEATGSRRTPVDSGP